MISASEVGFFSMTPKERKKLGESRSKKSKLIEKLLAKPELLLATILIANNFVNIAIIILSTYLSTYLLTGIDNQIIYILVQMVGITFIILLFGEMMPKVYAVKFPGTINRAMAYPLFILSKLFYPISFLLIKLTNGANRKLKSKHSPDINIQELSHAIELASDELKEDKEILTGIVNSSTLDVKEIMTSRIDVFAIEYNSNFSDILKQVIDSGFSRIPVYVNNLDNIRGVLYIKDILPYFNNKNEENFNWQKLIRPHFFVPETKKINELLSDFQTKKIHIALIVDEYGGVSGLVTLEDILEEFVGEIHDESDVEEKNYNKIDEITYEFDAKISIIDFCKIIGAEYNSFYDLKGESDSLAGLILEINGEIPRKDTKINIENFEFTVTSASDRRIKRIKVKKENENEN